MDISIKNIFKSFEKTPVIKGITLEIPSGEIICLLGPSGSGKTTMIRLLIGAIAADNGTIKFGKTTVPNLNLLNTIGFMPQNDALYDDLSGEDNLKFFAELYKVKKTEIPKRVDEMLELVNLTADRKKFVNKYSGGMKKRLSLAAALLHDPDVLLLDEPTVGIDPVLRHTIWERFKEMKGRGKTLIVSTHVMDEVYESDKAALIYDGRLIAFGKVQDMLADTVEGRIEELFFMAAERKRGEASC